MLNSKTIKKSALVGGTSAVLIASSFVASFEGLRLSTYQDPVGIPTVCYGYTRGVQENDSYTKEECDKLLNEEIVKYLNAVDYYITVPMPDTRRAALTSFAYNVGINNFKHSTLRRLMNEGKTRKACDELRRWVFAKGIKLRGLVRRREAERKLCMEGLPEDV